jgi:hypothetical protein
MMFKKILTFFPIANQHENPSLPKENFVEQLACGIKFVDHNTNPNSIIVEFENIH